MGRSAKMGETAEKPKKKICCACPETKGPRDTCIAEKGPDHEDCLKLIEAHKKCLRAEGFNVWIARRDAVLPEEIVHTCCYSPDAPLRRSVVLYLCNLTLLGLDRPGHRTWWVTV